LSSTKERYSPW